MIYHFLISLIIYLFLLCIVYYYTLYINYIFKMTMFGALFVLFAYVTSTYVLKRKRNWEGWLAELANRRVATRWIAHQPDELRKFFLFLIETFLPEGEIFSSS